MKRIKLLGVLAVLVFALAFLAACGNGDDEVVGIGQLAVGPVVGANVEAPPDIDRDHYRFHLWYGYTWMSGFPWGECVISAHWAELFNIHMYQSNPDATAMEVLMLMVTADDLPDAIWMERDQWAMQLASLGLLVPIEEMQAMVHNTWYNDYVGPETQSLLSFNGVNYAIPNWARTGTIGTPGGATGGNMAWMVTTDVFEAVGSPTIRTFEDLFDYAVAVRDAGLTNSLGVPIIPMLTNDGDSFGNEFISAIYRSMGGVWDGWWYTIKPDGTYGSVLRIPLWQDAVVEANRWFREGLFPVTNLVNTEAEFLANLNTGRGGLIFYDHSQDEGNNFRRLLREGDPGNSIELIYFEYGGRINLYPPARGLSPLRIYHEHHNTLGWNAVFVTTSAERPDRIFEFFSWLLTPMGVIEIMYGPRGVLWDSLDANGNPIMNVAPSLLPAEEQERIGLWNWTLVGASNHFDNIKFAVNNAMPEEYQSWVETIQYRLFTPQLRLTNEFVAIPLSIDGTSDVGIRRQQIADHLEEMLPQAIMAGSEAEARSILDSMLAFAEGLGLSEIEQIYNERYQYNLGTQGGSIFRPPGTP